MGGAMGGTVFSISLTMLAAFVFYFYPFSVRCGVWLWRMDNIPSTPLPASPLTALFPVFKGGID